MATDALSAIESFVSGVFEPSITFIVSWSTLIGIIGFTLVLVNANASAARGRPARPGMVASGLIFNTLLISLKPIINATGAQFGFSTTSFGAISYVSTGTFGEAAGAANAVLTILIPVGMSFFMQGVNTLRRSGLEGNTALSASESVAKGIKKIIFGTMMVFNTNVLDATISALNISL